MVMIMTKVAEKLGASKEDASKEMEEVLQFAMKLAVLTIKHISEVPSDLLTLLTLPPPEPIKVSDLRKEYPEVKTKVPLYQEV